MPVAAGTWEGNLKYCSEASKQDILFIQCKADPLTNFSRFGSSVGTYAQMTGCNPNTILLENKKDQNWILKEYQCDNHHVMHLIISEGGHIWPGGSQYLPAFLVGQSVKYPNVSQMIVNFFVLNKQP